MPRLGVNIDHVATIRNARGGKHPDPLRAAAAVAQAGADGITAHLREDRRHIGDDDIARLLQFVDLPLNLEMAATPEMLEIALRHKPHASCIVPEKRQELTTEGGLDAVGGYNLLAPFVRQLKGSKIRVSLFIDADPNQISAAALSGAEVVELHTGPFCDEFLEGNTRQAKRELERLMRGATQAHGLGLEVHAGHGLTFDTIGSVAASPEVTELNIGHFIVGEAIFSGLDSAVKRMRRLIHQARGDASGIQPA
jgi:pyridoxine 5-phosphate synthase